MLNWIHKLLNPHCEQCREDREDASICKACEVLRTQLEAANSEKRQLLSMLLPKQKEEAVDNTIKPEPIRTGQHVSFNIRRQMLEAEDRHKAALLIKSQKEIAEVPRDASIKTTISIPQSQSVEELEKELGVAENG